jgi:hypothetical protein
VDAPLHTAHDLIRPWRRATIAASAVAVAELVLLLGAGALLLAKPVSKMIERQAVAAATAAPSKQLAKAIKLISAPPGKARPRGRMAIMIFNGNGRAGAASAAAKTLRGLGYKITGTANAKRQDYATSIVMYKPGFRAEGIRLAKDLRVKVVGPLDGLKTGALHGGELTVIVGA